MTAGPHSRLEPNMVQYSPLCCFCITIPPYGKVEVGEVDLSQPEEPAQQGESEAAEETFDPPGRK